MMQAASNGAKEKVLLAFDFDHTIITENSDTYIAKLAPGGKLPKSIKDLYSDQGWTQFMGEVFKYLHQHKNTPEQILNCLTEIDFSPGMKELLNSLDKDNTETIIISDANSVFINHILDHHSMKDKIQQVFTNPAKFNQEGCLEIEMYHVQDSCSLSTVNLCKGQILESYIEERSKENIVFTHVAFIGDGQNDFCPSLRLSSKDFVFPRSGYSLVDYIQQMEAKKGLKIKANIHHWNSGLDILKVLTHHLPSIAPSVSL